MSLHSQSYLVHNHHMDTERRAADARRLAKQATTPIDHTTGAPIQMPSTTAVRRLVTQMTAAMKPLRRITSTPRI